MLVIRHVAHNLLAFAVCRPQILLAAALILGNDSIRCVQNGLGRAVILFQKNRVRLRVVALEFLDITDRGSAEGINGLIRVTHHTQFRSIMGKLSPSYQSRDESVLRVVGVLVFVDKHMLEAATIELHHLWVLVENAHNFTNEVIKIQ